MSDHKLHLAISLGISTTAYKLDLVLHLSKIDCLNTLNRDRPRANLDLVLRHSYKK